MLKFAGEKLGAEEGLLARERHALFYVALAESAGNLALTFTTDWQSLVAGEFDNMSAALLWSADARFDLALRLILALQSYWATYDPARGRALLETVVSSLRNKPAVSTVERATLLRECGEMAVRQADLPKGKTFLEESLELSGRGNDTAGNAATLTALGLIAMEQGEMEAARCRLQEAEEIYKSVGDAKGMAWVLRHEGVLARRTGDMQRAHACYEASQAHFHSIGDESGKAWILLASGETDIELGVLERAAESCALALLTFRDLGHKTGVMWALHRCGEVTLRLGDERQARVHFEECLTLAHQLENQTAIDLVTRALRY